MNAIALNIATGIAFFAAGFLLARISRSLVRKIFSRGKMKSATAGLFLSNLAYILVLVVSVSAALSRFGIETGSIVAILGAAGLAVGLSLQGSLSNFASGICLVWMDYFKVGDYIEGAGTGGTVTEVGLFSTVLATIDNREVIIPNSKLTADNVVNYSKNDTRRIDLVVSVSYSSDVGHVKRVLLEVMKENPMVLKSPEPFAGLLSFGDSAVDIAVRPWVKNKDYWACRFALLERIKERFDADGIEIPFPQQVVHIAGK